MFGKSNQTTSFVSCWVFFFSLIKMASFHQWCCEILPSASHWSPFPFHGFHWIIPFQENSDSKGWHCECTLFLSHRTSLAFFLDYIHLFLLILLIIYQLILNIKQDRPCIFGIATAKFIFDLFISLLIGFYELL